MRNLGAVGLLVFLLVLPLSYPQSAGSSTSLENLLHQDASSLSSIPSETISQYDPSAIFQRGVTFDLFSNITGCDPWPRDFKTGYLNGDDILDIAVISNYTNRITIFNGTSDSEFSDEPWLIQKADMVDLRNLAVGDLDGNGSDDLVVSHLTSGNASRVTIFYARDGFSPTTAVTLMTAIQPFEIVIGEFSGDSYNDIAVACSGGIPTADDKITVWRYPFLEVTDIIQVEVPSLTRGELLSGGMINSDDLMDLVVGNRSGTGAVVLYQPFSFVDDWGYKTLIVDGNITDIEVANITGAGIRDLAVLNSGFSRVQLYYNTGSDIPNTYSVIVPAYGNPVSVAFGEMSGDSRNDMILLSGAGGNASVHFQGGTGNWYPKANRTFPTNVNPLAAMVEYGEMRKHSVMILSSGNGGSGGSIEWFYGMSSALGNAGLNRLMHPHTPHGLASGTVELGGISFVTTIPSSNEIVVFDLASSKMNTLSAQSQPTDVEFGIYDLDSLEDIAVANIASASVSLFMGSSGIYTQKYPYLNVPLPLSSPSRIASAPLTQPSLHDIVIGCEGGVVILNNTGTPPYFSESEREVLLTGLTGIVTEVLVGGFTGQETGDDIAALTLGATSIHLFFKNPSGSPNNYYPENPSVYLTAGPGNSLVSMTVGHFNDDDLIDICALSQTGTVFIFIQKSGGFTLAQTPDDSFNLNEEANMVRSADLNDDGIEDLAFSLESPPKISIYLNHGSNVFTCNMNLTSGGISDDLIAEDVDGDGRADLATSAGTSFSISLWSQNNLVPRASATASTYVEKEGADILFDGSGSVDSYSDNSSLDYLWTFGDGTSDDSEIVSHRYLDNGTYSVSLRVADRGGLTNYSNLTVTIEDTAPTAAFVYAPVQVDEGQQVYFTDESTSYPDSIVNWTWQFGDGGIAYERNPIHSYTDDGNYGVILTVRDDDGSEDTETADVEVLDLSPTARFSVSTLNPMENATVLFTDESSSYPDEIVSYEWDFGDGTVVTILLGEIRNPTHVYESNGTYLVTLTVEDDDGSVDMYEITIQVEDSVPTALFEFGPSPLKEGDVVQFTDMSAAYDDVVGWRWDFGDGSPLSTIKNPAHQYADNGNYEVNLTAFDSDGSASYFIAVVVVHDTTPSLTSVTTSSGLTTFDEDEFFSIVARVTIAWEPVVKYEWDFSFNGIFVSDRTTGLNSTSYSFGQAGTYTIAVRAWDSDSFSERTITIVVLNIPPSADYTYFVTGAVVTFDASLSSDTPTDNETLEFRWNFGDGTLWSPWSKNPIIEHTFVNKSEEYKVVLNVRDEMYTRAMTRTLDLTPPTVSLISTAQTATVNKPTTIFVNASDVSGIRAVYLHYRIGSVNYTEIMTPSGSGTYQAQIPSQDRSMTIPYWLEAVDNHGNVFYSGEFEMLVQTVIPMEYWVAGIGILAFGLGGLVMGVRRRYASVDEVFIVYEDGRLIAHETRRLKPGMDDEVLSSMLVAIQSFVKDSFKDENVTTLKRLDFGEKKILIEKGDRVYLAGVLHGRHAGKVPQKMFRVLEDIERDFGPAFTEWDGDFEKVRGVKDKTQPLFKRQWPVPIRIVTLKKLRPKKSDITMVECPVCDSLVPADSKICPSCGVELAHADVDDLERVARDMMDARPNPDSGGEGADGEGERKGEE